MNRMEFLEPWRRIYAGPRVRSAHPVLHSRPAFACMAGSSESCTHSPEGNTPVAAVAATGCAPRGSGWSRGHDGSAAPSPLVWAAAWDMPGRTGLVRRSSPRASSRNDALASTITLRRALLRGQFAHEAWRKTTWKLDAAKCQRRPGVDPHPQSAPTRRTLPDPPLPDPLARPP